MSIGCLMLATMDPKLQKQHEHMGAYDMIVHLRHLYQEQARHERFNVSKALFQAKLIESSPGKVFVIRTAVFLEKEFLFKGTCGRKLGLVEVLPQNDIDQSTGKVTGQPQGVVVQSSTQVTQEPRRSGRIHHEPERYGFLVTRDNDVLLVYNDEPTTYAEAVTDPYSEKWLDVMRSEMEFMYTNQVWTLVDPPEGVKPIGCKWVFKKKTDMDGNVITFKGRLVAKGFKQVDGVDYDETFSPVAMLKSIRILLSVKTWLGMCFSMKDLGEATYMLGIKICRDRSRRVLGLSQSAYVDKVIWRFSMQDSKKGSLPMLHGISLSKARSPSTQEERDRMNRIPYASVIGSIISKQETVADSTTEAEYLTAFNATTEAVWIKTFVTELAIVPHIADPVELYCDNNRAITQAKEPRSHQRSKHILRCFYLIRKIVDIGDVKICKIPTDENLADLLTKPFVQRKHEAHIRSLGIRNMPDWL
ncbi:hypothetical protein CRG98_045199 [Punica granatum]|uniref:Reverse transcriptase Ty1/copia-type domain-containing protein n=1 Tax=Punica granatum TaxID=22663 RepID=A0A2I0HSF1_PUNGR|nr:hypothetical protein CRG98_045199 [Punica granatum]